MFLIAICSRCGKKIGLVTALVHDEKKLCLTCIVDDERAEKELKQKPQQKSQQKSQSASIGELETLRDSGAIPEEVFADAKESLLQGRPVIIERAMPEPIKLEARAASTVQAHTSHVPNSLPWVMLIIACLVLFIGTAGYSYFSLKYQKQVELNVKP